MSGIRSITLGTENIDKTHDLFHNIIGMPCKKQKNAIQFGDAFLSPGTRLQFVEIPKSIANDSSHFKTVGLRTPSHLGVDEYKAILDTHQIQHSDITSLNQNLHFHFWDDNEQQFDIFSNELNAGISLGTPSENSSVNPIHQVQGVGPIILHTIKKPVLMTLLSKIFNFEPYAKYQQNGQDIFVLQRSGGGLGAEIHVLADKDEFPRHDYGVLEQVEFTAENAEEFHNTIKTLKENDIPYEHLRNSEAQTESIRVLDITGLGLLLTLDK